MADYENHTKGAIVRIHLINFLTYSKTEFYPGPNMNMVIGPNGTGKSTVVCAIALGLGGKTDVLGRAKELQEFVKHGEHEATVEIELKNSPRNTIIKRKFSRGSNGSKWFLNDQTSTELEIKNIVSKFNIQVDNLCQFLPQDKVAGFAQMNPQKLLCETERAAGKDLLENHQLLTEKQAELKKMQSKLSVVESDLKTLQDKNSRLENDVKLIQERDKIQSDIKKYTAKHCVAKYHQATQNYLEGKEKLKALEQEYVRLSANLNPLREEVKKLKLEIQHCMTKDRKLRGRLDEEVKELQAVLATNEQKGIQIENVARKINEIKSEEKERAKTINNLEKEIEKLKDDIRTKENVLIKKEIMNNDCTIAEPIPKIAELNGKLEECRKRAQLLANDSIGIQERKSEYVQKHHEYNREKSHIMEQLNNLDDIQNQKVRILREANRHAYEALMWLRSNRDIFEGKVHEPLFLELSVKDKAFASAIEAAAGNNSLFTFVCENQKDYYLLRQKVMQEQRLRINIAVPANDLDYYYRNSDHKTATKYGFDGVALDFVEGPDAVISYLCQTSSLHKYPVALNEFGDSDLKRIENSGQFSRFIAGSMITAIKAAYGSQSVRVETMRPARFLSFTVDQEVKHQLENRMDAIERKISQNEQEKAVFEKEEATIKEKHQEISEEKKEIDGMKRAIYNLVNEYKNYSMKLESKQVSLQRELDRPSKEVEIAQLKQKLVELQRARANASFAATSIIKKTYECNSKVVENKLREVDYSIEVKNKEEEIRNRTENEQNITMQINQQKLVSDRNKQLAREAKGAVDKLKETATKEIAAILSLREIEETPEELNDKIIELNAQLENINDVDPTVVVEYRQRAKQIQDMEKTFDSNKSAAEEHEQEMQTLHDSWKGELTEIVSVISQAFSDNFAVIGCVGEVRIKEDADYKEWGIEIWVKFRDAETLQLLTANRQSGGERSVSTMLYLIALQALSKSPFRVVDEINQGMDPRNERLVHRLIVQAACVKSNSQ
ncbi:Structural maintenance of chromosomes protein 5 [Boothiomyces macroporosus]|uniref:Structural maintenance of chromosomes protein 5 n=1 Tax=Boothiomyces macroporosus TaxID=261099 RepID=A0AAD5Y6T1_9FUNG|nr:Structural maintenance of chromosomes protein 5 [Boothiomyces macroporosus]